jgi:hypothetical protein
MLTPKRSKLERRAILAGASVCAFMVPWTAALYRWLPATAPAHHWNLAWTGLDAAEGAAAGLTALLVHRRDHRAALPAVVLATLLAVDAWFDVCTAAPGGARLASAADAALVELPIAGAAALVAGRLLTMRATPSDCSTRVVRLPAERAEGISAGTFP